MAHLKKGFLVVFSNAGEFKPIVYSRSSKSYISKFIDNNNNGEIQIFENKADADLFSKKKFDEWIQTKNKNKKQLAIQKIKQMQLSQVLGLPVFNNYLVTTNLVEPIPKQMNVHIKSFGKLKILSYCGKINNIVYFQRKQPKVFDKNNIHSFNEMLIWILMDCNIKKIQRVKIILQQNSLNSQKKTLNPPLKLIKQLAIIQSLSKRFTSINYLVKNEPINLF